jgi:hypothetical protein
MGIYGSTRIYCVLREAGLVCGENRVSRLVKAAQVAPKQLQRHFRHDEPDHA